MKAETIWKFSPEGAKMVWFNGISPTSRATALHERVMKGARKCMSLVLLLYTKNQGVKNQVVDGHDCWLG